MNGVKSRIHWYGESERANVAKVQELMGVSECRAVGLLFEHTTFPVGSRADVWRQFRDWYGGRHAS